MTKEIQTTDIKNWWADCCRHTTFQLRPIINNLDLHNIYFHRNTKPLKKKNLILFNTS